MTTTDYRLERTVVAKQYNILLRASPRRRTFSGELRFAAQATAPVTTVELHARGLTVSDVVVRSAAGRQKARVRRHAARETVTLQVAKAVRGPLQIDLRFRGKLGSGMHGLYLAQDGPQRAIVSQCEATDARAIFPCLDEPDRKAKLQWQVQTDAGLQVITNGVLQASKKVRGRQEVLHTFAPTRVISTYLAAVTIGAFDASPTQKIAGTPCRIFAGTGKAEQTQFAQEVTAFVLPYYTRYFGARYNYHKLDQVAVPGFDAGAMENVGAIFYRQTLLLMRQNAVSWSGQKRIAEVIAHEIAHQWFGNLVTMQWWDDLWLNEAFATWIAYKACDTWQPQWRMWDDFLQSKMDAMHADALATTHPIYTAVTSPAQATELFDVITYEKGCGVLRMVESFMGAEAFEAGIKAYMAAFKNKNARGADLWTKLSAQVKEPVDDLMQSWVTQPGYPLLRCTRQTQQGVHVLKLGQQRFFSDPALFAQAQQQAAATWHVPLVIQYSADGKVDQMRAYLKDATASIQLPCKKIDWVYPNAAAAGFFRVALDETALAQLLQHGLRHLAPTARCGLLDDQWALVCCGQAHVESFLQTLQALRHERDHAVLRTVAGRLFALGQRLVPDQALPLFAAFVRYFLAPQLQELGCDPQADEPAPQAVRRASVLGALGELGRDAQVLQAAQAFVEREVQDPYAVEPNLAGVMISLHALQGDKRRLQQYVGYYQARRAKGLPPQLQGRYLGALSSFEDKHAVKSILSMCLDDTIAQEQLRSVLTPLLARRATQAQTWTFLQKHWTLIAPRIGGMCIARLVESLGALPAAQEPVLRRFFAKHPVAEASRAIEKAYEAMRLREALQAREGPRLEAWLQRWAAETQPKP